MSGFLRTVGQVAGTVASIAAFIPGAQPIAAAAAAVATVATLGAQLTAKPPSAKGQINERILGANNPLPLMIGRSYSGGVQVHDVGYGGEVNDVENPYRFMASVYSCCGPVQALESVQVDYSATSFGAGTPGNASGYYADYLYRDFQLGARPESDALQAQWSGTPDWGSSHKLSGFAAIGFSLKWSKKGKRFPGGQIPVLGAIWQGVKVYDPRLDSTFPGGSGSHRITDESTWEYSRSPALHALAYGYGRYVNGVKVFGVDLGDAAIDLASAVAWANVCDANSWYVDGTIYEPGDKWNNLKRICEAGGAVPVLDGGILTFDYQAPRTSLYTVTRDDLAGGITASLSKGWKSRINTIVPRYRSEAHQWNYVQSDPVSVAAFVTADGEKKEDERQWDLVTDKDQAAQLTLYDLYQRREAGPIRVPCKPHMREYRPGACLTLDEELGAHPAGTVKVLVRRRIVDITVGLIELECELETDAKHTEALAATGTAPSTITLPTSEDLEAALALNQLPTGYVTSLIAASYVTDADPADGLVQASESGGTTTITVESHTRTYADIGVVSVTGGSLTVEDDGSTAITTETTYHIYYDDIARAGGSVALKATKVSTTAATSETNPGRHRIATVTTPAAGGSSSAGGTTPGGWDPGDFYETP